MDLVLQSLLRAERFLEAELESTPLYQLLDDVRDLIDRRRAMNGRVVPMIPLDRLLCEMVHEAQAVTDWENEGGASR